MCYTDNQREKASNDRRQRNDGPPAGMRERRSGLDRRQTDIGDISMDEWLKYAGTGAQQSLPKPVVITEEAADVFDRAASRHF